MMTRRFLKILSWFCLAGIVAVTVSPIDLRPHDLLPADIDRALAFTLLSGLFVIAYPRHFWLCATLLIASAGIIELLQNLSPTRHARADDALVKAAGAGIGVMVAWAVNQLIDLIERQPTASAYSTMPAAAENTGRLLKPSQADRAAEDFERDLQLSSVAK